MESPSGKKNGEKRAKSRNYHLEESGQKGTTTKIRCLLRGRGSRRRDLIYVFEFREKPEKNTLKMRFNWKKMYRRVQGRTGKIMEA